MLCDADCDGTRLPVPLRRVGVIMALQAEREHDRPPQQARVHGAMRLMAGLAAFHPQRRVLENPRTAFIGVALHARRLIAERLLHHTRAVGHAPRGGERCRADYDSRSTAPRLR